MNLGIVFTEHVDFVTPSAGRNPHANDLPKQARDFLFDYETYPYHSLRCETALMGLEIGLTDAYLPLNKTTADGDYDYIIGSIHFVDGNDVYRDYRDIAPLEADVYCRRYLTYAKEMVEISGFFDALAHIDYICRYCASADTLFEYANFPMEFDALFKLIAERNLALEINTSRFQHGARVIKQLLPIYTMFKQLGGKWVTIGSDSHNAESLGRYFKQALEIARHAELTPVYFKERKMHIS